MFFFFLSSPLPLPLPLLLLAIIAHYPSLCTSQCPHNCHQNGQCNQYSRCDCFAGYEGYDCSKRSCPIGRMYAGIASGENTHSYGECSGRGHCDHQTGLCQCDVANGFYGLSCQYKQCPNSCNSHGKCISLQQAAELYDGWTLNHTTSYSLPWDANLLFGCQCDPGYSGYDCSERICESGPDPRVTTSSHEIVTLICETASNIYSGKFKLRFQGNLMRNFLETSSTVTDLQRELMNINSQYANLYPTLYTPITVTSDNVDGFLCADTATVTTTIKYHKKHPTP